MALGLAAVAAHLRVNGSFGKGNSFVFANSFQSRLSRHGDFDVELHARSQARYSSHPGALDTREAVARSISAAYRFSSNKLVIGTSDNSYNLGSNVRSMQSVESTN